MKRASVVPAGERRDPQNGPRPWQRPVPSLLRIRVWVEPLTPLAFIEPDLRPVLWRYIDIAPDVQIWRRGEN